MCGRTVAEAFDDLYYLERAAMVQVLAMSTGSPLVAVPSAIAHATKTQIDRDRAEAARLHFEALRRVLPAGAKRTPL